MRRSPLPCPLMVTKHTAPDPTGLQCTRQKLTLVSAGPPSLSRRVIAGFSPATRIFAAGACAGPPGDGCCAWTSNAINTNAPATVIERCRIVIMRRILPAPELALACAAGPLLTASIPFTLPWSGESRTLRPSRNGAHSMKTLGVAACMAIAITASVTGHHSFAAEFDGSKIQTIKGSVVEFQWMNPHAYLIVD